MPMPPPKPSTELRDRVVAHEVGQIVRALRVEGPQSMDDLAELVGGRYWDPGRFERAVLAAVSNGRAIQQRDGRYSAV
jgi:predicted transcriptional regulator